MAVFPASLNWVKRASPEVFGATSDHSLGSHCWESTAGAGSHDQSCGPSVVLRAAKRWPPNATIEGTAFFDGIQCSEHGGIGGDRRRSGPVGVRGGAVLPVRASRRGTWGGRADRVRDAAVVGDVDRAVEVADGVHHQGGLARVGRRTLPAHRGEVDAAQVDEVAAGRSLVAGHRRHRLEHVEHRARRGAAAVVQAEEDLVEREAGRAHHPRRAALAGGDLDVGEIVVSARERNRAIGEIRVTRSAGGRGAGEQVPLDAVHRARGEDGAAALVVRTAGGGVLRAPERADGVAVGSAEDEQRLVSRVPRVVAQERRVHLELPVDGHGSRPVRRHPHGRRAPLVRSGIEHALVGEEIGEVGAVRREGVQHDFSVSSPTRACSTPDRTRGASGRAHGARRDGTPSIDWKLEWSCIAAGQRRRELGLPAAAHPRRSPTATAPSARWVRADATAWCSEGGRAVSTSGHGEWRQVVPLAAREMSRTHSISPMARFRSRAGNNKSRPTSGIAAGQGGGTDDERGPLQRSTRSSSVCTTAAAPRRDRCSTSSTIHRSPLPRLRPAATSVKPAQTSRGGPLTLLPNSGQAALIVEELLHPPTSRARSTSPTQRSAHSIGSPTPCTAPRSRTGRTAPPRTPTRHTGDVGRRRFRRARSIEYLEEGGAFDGRIQEAASSPRAIPPSTQLWSSFLPPPSIPGMRSRARVSGWCRAKHLGRCALHPVSNDAGNTSAITLLVRRPGQSTSRLTRTASASTGRGTATASTSSDFTGHGPSAGRLAAWRETDSAVTRLLVGHLYLQRSPSGCLSAGTGSARPAPLPPRA